MYFFSAAELTFKNISTLSGRAVCELWRKFTHSSSRQPQRPYIMYASWKMPAADDANTLRAALHRQFINYWNARYAYKHTRVYLGARIVFYQRTCTFSNHSLWNSGRLLGYINFRHRMIGVIENPKGIFICLSNKTAVWIICCWHVSAGRLFVFRIYGILRLAHSLAGLRRGNGTGFPSALFPKIKATNLPSEALKHFHVRAICSVLLDFRL
jgi:hypothetical protein